MSDQGYTFSWHTLREHDDQEAFVRWFVVSLILSQRQNDKLVDELSAMTDGFTKVTMTIQLNGVEVDVEHLLRDVYRNMWHHAQRTAVDELKARIDVQRLHADATAIQDALTSRARAVARELGVDVDWSEEV